MVKKAFLLKLKKAYKENKLIPFIGTGLAVPFDIPNWGDLIIEIAENNVEENLMVAIKKYVERENYWKAIDATKEFGEMSDRDVQDEIAKIIKQHMKNEIDQENHNYLDLARGHFSNILTTNYDLLITKYINDPLVIPQVLYKVRFNSQSFFECDDNKSKVWHLHGHIKDEDSIIISEEKYNELYRNEQYKKLFEVFQAQGVLLFIGFSMNDKYIKDLLEKNKLYFNSQHYIMLDRPDDKIKKILKNDYSVNVIEYDASKKGHAQAIREILNEIIEDSTDDKIEEKDSEEEFKKKSVDIVGESTILLRVPEIEEREELSKCRFYKKLLIEDIDEISREFSQDCYFMADIATRMLRKKGFTEQLIESILTIAYMEFSKVKYNVYRHTHNSQLFLESVHTVLEKYDFYENENLNNKLNFYPLQKQGFIHILADNSKKDIWWGSERKIEE